MKNEADKLLAELATIYSPVGPNTQHAVRRAFRPLYEKVLDAITEPIFGKPSWVATGEVIQKHSKQLSKIGFSPTGRSLWNR